ncbi:double-strand break repair helicase AddA [Ferruginivarius sediminum]|uniref:DNA 3'-5' helicase n=1 Tax=Ferruginivarius sediminum TaxID=2661937 RepID=A0A369TBU6_9PROT|nr:double-strand break repair helicase AddA [Ferruginivarius sediminum]RDD60396.1 double-strand break repair helicase AddA [Ferruginivarius sediminum]
MSTGDVTDPSAGHADTRKREAQQAQRRASDPAASVWVAASAGTGKTKVLTDRVLSLMLAGTPPAKILCLTFTKAAAAEMSNRLAARLAGWATAGDTDLDSALHELTGQRPDDAMRRRARELFARVLDAPGGMKIQTIHAFCQSVLARFPLEAGVPPHFQVLDERSAAEMLQAAREEVLARAGSGDDWGEDAARLAEALSEVTAQASEMTFNDLMAELIRQRGRLARLLREAGGMDALAAGIRETLDVAEDDRPADVVARACRDDAFDAMGLRVAETAMRQGTKTEQGKADILKAWLDAPAPDRGARFDDYAGLFLTAKGEVRSRLLTKQAAEVGGALEVMEAEAERLLTVRERINATVVARATAGLLRLGAAILDAYERHKRRRALLDYDDLIIVTRDLLQRPGIAPWVLFKLDGGLDHVLIDEAQDTNPEQWEVVGALTDEFFAGEGAAEGRDAGTRTVFAVGDAKQSIYSFQRAEPAAFARMRRHFAERARQARHGWSSVELNVSFRSTDAVLAAVDAVFAQPDARDGVLFGEDALRHEPVRAGHAGLVELWPPAEPGDAGEPEAWAPPVEAEGQAPPRQRLARLIAARIARWTQGETPDGILHARGRPIVPGDVLVLVRRRNEFVEELVRELKLRQVPVAGVDRMVLSEQLAVMDLAALGRFLLLPEDDLTLACVLKGPLIGLSEERLFELAYGREGRLWDALRSRAGENADFEDAHARLGDLLARADFTPPYELYAELLGAGRGRERILARLGPEANDPIDEFLALALAYEREHVPSLEGFLHWLEAGQQEVKRDAEHGGNAVRVMTVHGAKGLQAPIVFLPDTLQVPTQSDKLLWDDGTGLALWPPRKEFDDEVAGGLRAAARADQEPEYRRLLYVAMTRAEDRLYICGWNTQRSGQEHCWYKLIQRGLAGVAEPAAFDFTADLPDGWQGEGLRLETAQRTESESKTAVQESELPPTPLPDWAQSPPRPEPAPPRPLAPSRPPDAEPPVRSPLEGDNGASYQRGRLIHRLLQSLPDLADSQRRAAAERFLASPVHGLDSAQQAQIVEETLAVLENPEFAALFGPGSAAEVPIVGLLDGEKGPEAVTGQIDRLLVTDEIVTVVDYKTNRPPPRTPEEVPDVYRRQLRGYRRLLEKVYPGRRIETWLLWTDGPRMMQISDA